MKTMLSEFSESELKRALCEGDVNFFTEAVLRDERGEPVQQAEHHRVMQAHIDWCQEHGQHCLILAPWGSGKSEQTIARILHWLINNPELRIKIISDIAGNANQRLKALMRYIESMEWGAMFPDVGPMGGLNKAVQWTSQKILIDRKSPGKDATVEAWGVTSAGTGTRAEILVIDDPVGESAIHSEAAREAVKSAVRSTWMSRLVDGGFILYIATVWHAEDLTSELERNERFSVCKMCIADDFEGIDVSWQRIDESHPYHGTTRLPLWEKNNKEFLLQKVKEIGTREFERGYKHNPLTLGSMTFPHFQKCYVDTLPDGVEDWPKYGGVDFSSDSKKGNVFFTVALSPDNNTVVPIDMVRTDAAGPDFAKMIAKNYEKHHHKAIFTETNGVQESLLTWLRTWRDLPNMPLRGYHTGAQKNGAEVGLPSIDIEFENNMWKIPRNKHEVTCGCDWCVWHDSMKWHPQAKEDDTVMAMWLAREASRQGTKRIRVWRV